MSVSAYSSGADRRSPCVELRCDDPCQVGSHSIHRPGGRASPQIAVPKSVKSLKWTGLRRSVIQNYCVSPAALGYQILQACSRTIGWPFLQPKALRNSAIFESGPLPRNLGSGCGLVVAINRAYSIRSLAPQTCVQPRKTEQFEHLRDIDRKSVV